MGRTFTVTAIDFADGGKEFQRRKKNLDDAIWDLFHFFDDYDLNDQMAEVEKRLSQGALQLTDEMLALGTRPLASPFVGDKEAAL